MSENDFYEDILKHLDEQVEKHGDNLLYVSFPWSADGHSFKTIQVLTPIGQQTLQEYLDIRERLLGESDDSNLEQK